MDNFDLNEYMDLAEAYVGPLIDAIHLRLMDRDFALEDPEVVMLLAALINILRHDNLGDRLCHPSEMPLPTKPGLRRMLQEMNSEAASSSSQLRAAGPPKRAIVEEEVHTNETKQDLNGTIEEQEKTRRELDEMTKTMLSTEEDIYIWKRLFEDCNKKKGKEIERMRLALTTAV